MRYVEGIQRTQTLMFPETIESYISEDSLVRFIEAYVNRLDMAAFGFTYSEPKETGRKPYNPADMLKLYIYGYLNRIRSSRSLETEAQRNIELIWLMKKLTPDFKTIADFRKDNIKSLKKVCREFTMLCKRLDLFSKELVAIDGSKFRAVNSRDRSYSKKKLSMMIKEIDEKVNQYLTEVEIADTREQKWKSHSKEEIEQIIGSLESKKKELHQMMEQIESSEESQINQTDPECRMMSSCDGKHPSYNVQIAVEAENHFILDFEVSNKGNDLNSLSIMADKAKDVLNAEELKVVADAGYYSKSDIAKCVDKSIECYIPSRPSSNIKQGLYKLDMFAYDAEKDQYICPMGKGLKYICSFKKSNLMMRKYECYECKRCTKKSKCTTSNRNRSVYRWERQEILESMKMRLQANPLMMQKRKATVEHVFGTIKHWFGYRHFLMKGKINTTGEMSLAVLSYNMKRAINIIGIKPMIAAL